MNIAPRPWFVSNGKVKHFDHKKAYTIASVGNKSFTPDANNAIANLISAAPDLLLAMEALFEQCVMIHKYGGTAYNQKEADEAISDAKIAIAKARGGK